MNYLKSNELLMHLIFSIEQSTEIFPWCRQDVITASVAQLNFIMTMSADTISQSQLAVQMQPEK